MHRMLTHGIPYWLLTTHWTRRKHLRIFLAWSELWTIWNSPLICCYTYRHCGINKSSPTRNEFSAMLNSVIEKGERKRKKFQQRKIFHPSTSWRRQSDGEFQMNWSSFYFARTSFFLLLLLPLTLVHFPAHLQHKLFIPMRLSSFRSSCGGIFHREYWNFYSSSW